MEFIMQKKTLLALVLVGLTLTTGYATAQSYFSFKPTPTLAANSDSPAGVMSPSDFQSQTQQTIQQRNDAANKQLKDQIDKVPHTPKPTPPPANPVPQSSAPATATPPTSDAAPSVPPVAQQPQATPNGNDASQPQVYTGFGGKGDNSSGSSPSKKSNGLNIQY
jgi:hypothetical protein